MINKISKEERLQQKLRILYDYNPNLSKIEAAALLNKLDTKINNLIRKSKEEEKLEILKKPINFESKYVYDSEIDPDIN